MVIAPSNLATYQIKVLSGQTLSTPFDLYNATLSGIFFDIVDGSMLQFRASRALLGTLSHVGKADSYADFLPVYGDDNARVEVSIGTGRCVGVDVAAAKLAPFRHLQLEFVTAQTADRLINIAAKQP